MLRLCGLLKVKLHGTQHQLQGLGAADLQFGRGEDTTLQNMVPAFSFLYSALESIEVNWSRLELAGHDGSGQEKKRQYRAVCIPADCTSLAVGFDFRFAASEPSLEAISIIAQ